MAPPLVEGGTVGGLVLDRLPAEVTDGRGEFVDVEPRLLAAHADHPVTGLIRPNP